MYKKFDEDFFYGLLVKGNLKDAVQYLKQFPSKKELYNKYMSVFEEEQYFTYDDDYISNLFIIYQKYYRDVFYSGIDADTAVENMKVRFEDFFKIKNDNAEFSNIEENNIAAAFRDRSFQFLGGRTAGYFGPYIWKTEELVKYNVELPDGIKEYSIKFLDGFISKGWYDYISFGAISTGGFTNKDGIINCIKSSYNIEDESFKVSLLKHEAQHAADLSKYKDMSSEDLEYRAKLVELIYSNERNLLKRFVYETDISKENNGHSLAANRIVNEFKKNQNKKAEEFDSISIKEIQSIAKELFIKSNEEISLKYK